MEKSSGDREDRFQPGPDFFSVLGLAGVAVDVVVVTVTVVVIVVQKREKETLFLDFW